MWIKYGRELFKQQNVANNLTESTQSLNHSNNFLILESILEPNIFN